eukprot:747280_1
MTDYSKFNKLVQEEEENEKREKEAERLRLRLKYEKEQKEKQKIWDEKLLSEGKDPVSERHKYGGCAFQQMQHMQQMQHTHNNDKHDKHDKHNNSKSTCGYMSFEQIKQLEKKKKTISVADKNIKKIEAVYAAKTDGNRIFADGNYELAYKVYERGALIINGMFELNDEQEIEMENVECALDLNMALVSLKMENWSEAISCCQMAIQINDKNAKSYYRWSEALIGMSEYDKARKQSNKAKELEPKNIAINRQLKRIQQLEKKQNDKAKQE